MIQELRKCVLWRNYKTRLGASPDNYIVYSKIRPSLPRRRLFSEMPLPNYFTFKLSLSYIWTTHGMR